MLTVRGHEGPDELLQGTEQAAGAVLEATAVSAVALQVEQQPLQDNAMGVADTEAGCKAMPGRATMQVTQGSSASACCGHKRTFT